MSARLKQLRRELAARTLDAILITHPAHIRYLSGFSGSSGWLVVDDNGATLVTDFRYRDQIASELVDGVDGFIYERSPWTELMAAGILRKGMLLGFQEDAVTVALYNSLRKNLKSVKLETTGALVADLVAIKTDEEVGYIKKAGGMAARVYRDILAMARPGIRENEIAMEISYHGRKYGSEADAFDIIVASGPRGALPHGRASDRKIRKGDLVTLDFGCRYKGFNSDMTRTFAVGEPSAEGRAIYNVVLHAQRRGVRAARAGITNYQLDAVCRDSIVAAGFGLYFGHGTGHGLGIDVHEAPSVSFKGETRELMPGMVVTIEPGIYIPGRLGVRIEDDVVITETGCRQLTSSPRDLIVV